VKFSLRFSQVVRRLHGHVEKFVENLVEKQEEHPSHHDSAAHPTHFTAMNLQGHVEILEIPGGDASHARMLVGPTLSGDGADLVPVTLRLVDRQGNHHPDLLVQCGAVELWFKNENGGFVAL